MNNNKILRLALFATRFMLAGVIILAAILIILMVMYQFTPENLENFRLVNDGSIFRFETGKDKPGIALAEYGAFYFYFACIKALITTAVVFLIIQTAGRIIQSISSLNTFRTENIHSFRRMGFLFLTWMLLNIPTIKNVDDTVELTVQLLLNYAVYALICFVLAEIFKEGNRLHEENQLTI